MKHSSYIFRILIIIAESIFSLMTVLGQSTWSFTYSTLLDEVPSDAIETSDGGFIVAVKQGDFTSNTYSTLLLNFDNAGDTVKTKLISKSPANCYVADLVKSSDGNYFAIGMQRSLGQDVLWILKFDPNLNILMDTTYLHESYRIIYYFGFIDSFDNLIVYGNSRLDGNDPDHAFILKLSQNGESLGYQRLTGNGSQMVFSMIQRPDSSCYLMMVVGYYQFNWPSGGSILTFDNDLNFIRTDSLPDNLILYYNSKFINKTQFLLTGKKVINYYPRTDQLGILTMDTSFHVLKTYNLGPEDTISYPGYLHNLDFAENDVIYYGGTVNQSIFTEFSENNSYCIVGLFDTLLNLRWQKYFGGDQYYNLWALLATMDGGSLLLCSTYNYLIQNSERDIKIFKVDSSGTIVSSGTSPGNSLSDAIVYPNPGKDFLIVQSGPQIVGSQVILSDLAGSPVITEIISGGETKINTTTLPYGFYIWQIIRDGRMIDSGKWIKF